MPQGIDVQVPSLTSPGTEQLEADDVMALARESNDLLPDCRQVLSRWRGGRYACRWLEVGLRTSLVAELGAPYD